MQKTDDSVCGTRGVGKLSEEVRQIPFCETCYEKAADLIDRCRRLEQYRNETFCIHNFYGAVLGFGIGFWFGITQLVAK